MTTETMIERLGGVIALAVARSAAENEHGAVGYTDVARAALEALLEPSEGMEAAAFVVTGTIAGKAVFRAMIQAALDGK